MSRFLNETMSDIRDGRETWRVFLACCAPALALAILLAVR
jgi:hypothetical protein